MSWYERLAARLREQGRFLDIMGRTPDGEGDEVYLSRYYLIPGPRRLDGTTDNEKRRFRWFSAFLHNIHLSDEPVGHFHPWPFVSIVLSGGYWEHRPTGRSWRRPGSIAIRSHMASHWIEIDPSVGPVWTLFMVGPRRIPWGFWAAGWGCRMLLWWIRLYRPDLAAPWFHRRPGGNRLPP